MTNAPAATISLRMTLAHAMAERRAQLGLSQRQLAKLAGVRGAFIGGVEACSINVSLVNLERIRTALWPSPHPIQKLLADSLRTSRQKVSQERLAELAHVSISLIASVESGNANTSLDQVEALATALGQDPAKWLWLDEATLRSLEPDMPDASDLETEDRLRSVVAEDLRKLRQFHAITQADLAEALGLSKGQISQIENARTNFTLTTVERYVGAVTNQKPVKDDSSYAKKLGEQLWAIRHKEKLGQEDLAQISGVTVSLVGRIERGTAAVSMDQLELITLALGIKGQDILRTLYPTISKSLTPKNLRLLPSARSVSAKTK